MMVFNDNENDKNDKSKNDNNNNHNKKLRSRGTNNMHEVILRGNRYILFANLLATHRKFFPSRSIKDFFIKKKPFLSQFIKNKLVRNQITIIVNLK